MDAINEFQGAAVLVLLFALRFALPFCGIYCIYRMNQALYRLLGIEETDSLAF